jgi:RNA polymerase sigma-70 factor (ECF subfamily)
MPFNQLAQQPGDGEIIHHLLQEGVERKRGEEQLFSTYAYFIDKAIRQFSFREDEAFNIYADTILSAIGQISGGNFEGRASLKTWLHQIFHNKCVDLMRKKTTNKSRVHRALAIPDMLMQMADTAKSVVQEMMDKTNKDELQQKLKILGENCRRMLLFWADGYTDREIAVTLEYKTADVVKTSRLRCLEKLRQLYFNK